MSVLSDYVDKIEYAFNQYQVAYTNAIGHLNQAATFFADGDYLSGGNQLGLMSQDLTAGGGWFYHTYPVTVRTNLVSALYWINSNWPAGVTVDMASILTAMLGATFNQLQNFIGIEDAYRVALWNAPFNADYYASLARGFIKWP